MKINLNVFYFAFVLFFSHASIAWELDRSGPYGKIFELDQELVVAESDVMRFTRSNAVMLAGFEALSLKIVIQPATADWTSLFLYDKDGVLKEQILRKAMNSENPESFWTDFIEGDTVSLHVHARGGAAFSVRIISAVAEGVAGHENVVVGTPVFEPSDALGRAGPGHMVQFVANLLLDPNKEDEIGSPLTWSQPCTGILITPNLLLTAGHCLKFSRENCSRTIAFFGLGHDPHVPITARRCTEVVYLGHALDTAVLRLDGNGPQGRYPRLGRFAPRYRQKLIIIQHPRGNMVRISRDDHCRVSTAIADLIPQSNKVGLAGGKGAGFRHECDTLEGSSGSPILSADGSNIIGIQHAGHRFEGYNVAIRADYISHCIGFDARRRTLNPRQRDPICR